MFKQLNQKISSIRFRRWSRAKYAVFCSLRCAVTIGRLAVSIADKSLQKVIGVCFNLAFVVKCDDSQNKKKEINEFEALLLHIQENTFSEITLDTTAARGRKSNI
jgi:hypothetical protein